MAIRYLSGINVDSSTLFVDSTNNRVGIGTDSPAYRLDVNVTSNSDALRIQQAGAQRFILNGDGVMYWGNGAASGVLTWDTNIAYIGGLTNNALGIWAGGSEKVRITTGGNVLIGTTTDAGYKLNVNGSGRFSNNQAGGASVSTNNSNATDDAAISNLNFDGNRLRLGVLASDGAYGAIGSNGGTTGLAFVTHNGSAWSEKMRITPAGNVGIKAIPKDWASGYSALNIGAAATISWTGAGANDFSLSTNAYYDATDDRWEYGGTGDGSARYSMTALSYEHRWYNAPVGTANAAISYTQAMTLTGGGNLLIGTTTDGGYRLRVNGTGRYDDYLQLWSGTAGASPRLIFGGETSSTDKSIFLESYYMVFQGHDNEGFKFQTTSSLGVVTNRMSILGTGTVVLSNYGSGTKTGTPAYNLGVDASGNVIELPGGVVDGSGTANYVTKWQDANTVTDSQIVDNGTNVGINNASPKTKLDVNGAIGFGSKTLNISDTFVTVLTVNMSNHTGCYVKITAFGDWSGHSAVAYLGEFFLQNGASAYNEPGVIIRQVDNTNTDDVVAQIVDPAGTGTRDFEIQLKTTSASGVPFSAAIQYEVRGQYNSVS